MSNIDMNKIKNHPAFLAYTAGNVKIDKGEDNEANKDKSEGGE